MQSILEDALDKLVSPRSSLKIQTEALTAIERELAYALAPPKSEFKVAELIILQDSFQCNIASRTVAWLARQAQSLKALGDDKDYSVSLNNEEEHSIVIVQALSLLQGISFLHKPSKAYLGRKGSLEVLLDMLSTYRHARSKPVSSSVSSDSPRRAVAENHISQYLAVAVLDTLLCILVDSSSAMRAFEGARGVEQLVKILKRASIPKDVRMKCLEFIYFYLMNESPSASQDKLSLDVVTPPSPTKPSHHTLSSRNSQSSRATVSTSSEASDALLAVDRTASSTSLSPTPTLSGTPPLTPTKSSGKFFLRSQCDENEHHITPLSLLRKDVEFVPLSPKKAQIAGLGLGNRRPGAFPIASRRGQRMPSPLGRTTSEDTLLDSEQSVDGDDSYTVAGIEVNTVRTTEEKKELLSHLLGNVDALVEGIRSAGIWGFTG